MLNCDSSRQRVIILRALRLIQYPRWIVTQVKNWLASKFNFEVTRLYFNADFRSISSTHRIVTRNNQNSTACSEIQQLRRVIIQLIKIQFSIDPGVCIQLRGGGGSGMLSYTGIANSLPTKYILKIVCWYVLIFEFCVNYINFLSYLKPNKYFFLKFVRTGLSIR